MTNLLIIQSLNGVTIGLIFALIALGLTIVLGLMGIMNFAHGAFYTFGGYFAYMLFQHMGSFWLGLAAAALACAAIGLGLFVFMVRPLAKRSPLQALLGLVGVSMLFEQLSRSIWGAEPKVLPIPFGMVQVQAFGLDFPYPVYFLVAMGISVVILAGMSFLFRNADVGIRCLAAIQDREIASSMGVNVNLVSAFMFTLGMAVAGLAGGLGGPIFSVYPNMGIDLIGLLFVIAIVGGIGSVAGTVIAAVALGLAKSISSIFISGNYSEILAFALLLVILLIRPRGLMGVASVMD